jgi:hypothetical protein
MLERTMLRRIQARLTALVALALPFVACGETRLERDGSETHFLTECEDGSCPAGSECVCGVCTTGCSADDECTRVLGSATCVSLAPRVAEGRCPDSDAPSLCDVSCITSADCDSLSGDFVCDGGYCRAPGTTPPATDPLSCDLAPIAGSDVLILGDALIELTAFTADLEALAIGAGVLASGDHFRDYASSTTSFLSTAIPPYALLTEYQTARADGSARVAVLDGGAADFLLSQCGSAPTPDCPAMQAAVAGAEQIFAALAADGVEHVIYASYADVIGNDDLKASVDVLRPLVENACGRAALPCHFLDLRPAFAGHPDYLNPDGKGVVWSETGATVAAGEVFREMQARCVTGSR